MVKPWPRLDSESRGDFKVFSLREDRARSPRTGREHSYYVIECPAWVNVIPMTCDNEIVLVRQYRHGTAEVTLEIPGGMVDPTDPDPAAAAARELREETGYASDPLVHLGTVAPNPALQDNRCHTYLAAGARRVGPTQFDDGEDLAVELVSPQDIPRLIRSGIIEHALVVAAFYWFDAWHGSGS